MRLTSALLISLSLLGTSFTYASSEDDYEKALTAYSEARFDEAFIHLKNSLQQDPDNLAAKRGGLKGLEISPRPVEVEMF